MVHILLSGEGRGDLVHQLGAAHYSYIFAEGKFRSLIETSYPVTKVHYPFFHANTTLLREDLQISDPALVHIAFRSAENLRLIKGVYNICAFAWEFDILNDCDWLGQLPTQNQFRMLGLFDEIWATSHYTRQVLRSHGLRNVHWLPAPIEDSWSNALTADLSAFDDTLFYPFCVNLSTRLDLYASPFFSYGHRGAPKAVRQAVKNDSLYLTIVNPGDQRKNITNLICAFHEFAQSANPNATLLVKLSIPKSATMSLPELSAELEKALGRDFSINSDRIFLVAGYLSDETINAAYNIASFYLSPSLAEGQNLPLIEAMMARCIPVSSRNTAMHDYLSADNSVGIAGRDLPGYLLRLAPSDVRRSYKVQIPSAADIYDALCKASALSADERKMMRRAARKSALKHFSVDAMRPRVQARIDAISNRVSA